MSSWNKQENNEKLIVEFDKKGIQATSTTDADDLPSTWENYVVDAEDAKTIVVPEIAESDRKSVLRHGQLIFIWMKVGTE